MQLVVEDEAAEVGRAVMELAGPGGRNAVTSVCNFGESVKDFKQARDIRLEF